MLKLCYPNKEVNSVYKIPFDRLYKKGIRGIIFDIDNTLVPHGAEADERIISLFLELKKMGMKTCLLSNNKEPRVSSFAEQVEADYIFDGKKPLSGNYKKAMELMGTGKKETIFAGDQIFTDILGANIAGIYSVLVSPIHPREEIQIKIKRYLESIVLFFYHRKKKRKEKSND